MLKIYASVFVRSSFVFRYTSERMDWYLVFVLFMNVELVNIVVVRGCSVRDVLNLCIMFCLFLKFKLIWIVYVRNIMSCSRVFFFGMYARIILYFFFGIIGILVIDYFGLNLIFKNLCFFFCVSVFMVLMCYRIFSFVCVRFFSGAFESLNCLFGLSVMFCLFFVYLMMLFVLFIGVYLCCLMSEFRMCCTIG